MKWPLFQQLDALIQSYCSGSHHIIHWAWGRAQSTTVRRLCTVGTPNAASKRLGLGSERTKFQELKVSCQGGQPAQQKTKGGPKGHFVGHQHGRSRGVASSQSEVLLGKHNTTGSTQTALEGKISLCPKRQSKSIHWKHCAYLVWASKNQDQPHGIADSNGWRE